MKNFSAGRGDGAKSRFGGDLAAISLLEVCQFLLVLRRTGTLTVKCGKRFGTLAIREGQIVSVVDDELLPGEEAFYRVACWSEGTFEFAPGAVSGDAMEISTAGLLMEAARRLDEGEMVAEGLAAGGRHWAQSLLEGGDWAGDFAGLRPSLRSGNADEFDFRTELSLSALVASARREGTDELFLAAERPVRCRLASGIVDLDPAPLPERALEKLVHALRGSASARPQEGGEWTVERELASGEIVRARGRRDAGVETLHLRLLASEPPDLEEFGAEAESFVPALLSSGACLFLVGSSSAAARAPLCARLALELAEMGRHVLWAAERRDYALRPGRGWVETLDLLDRDRRRIRSRLEDTSGGALVLDPARSRAHVRSAVQAAARGAIAVVALEAEDIEETVRRFTALLAGSSDHVLSAVARHLRAALHVEEGDEREGERWRCRGGALSADTVGRLLGSDDTPRRAA